MKRNESRIYWEGYNCALEMVVEYLKTIEADYDGRDECYMRIDLDDWLKSKKMVNIEPEKYELVRKPEE